MRLYVFLILLICGLSSSGQVVQDVERRTGVLISKVPSLRNLKKDKSNPPVTRNLEGLIFKKQWKDDPVDYGSGSSDPVVQKKDSQQPGIRTRELSDESLNKISSNYEGIGFTSVAPADPCLAVGKSHVVQMINGSQGAYLRIWDKQGNSLIDPTYMFRMTGNSSYHAFGDPIVLYNQFADRYIISEFGSDSCASCYANSLVIGVSQTSDPTGGWYFYKFNPGSFFVDYPHYSVWPDALYATSNDYNASATSYLGSSVYAFDIAKMMAGDPGASFQRIRIRSTQYNKYISLAPVSISGSELPPPGTPGYFMYFHDDNRTATTADSDSIGIFSLKPDFFSTSNTIFSLEGNLPVAAFKSRVCNGTRNCIPSAAGSGYDDLGDRFMNKIYYRNFGTHESIVATHAVDASYPAIPATSGLRWYELRKSSSPWSVYQQGTYAPDGDGRWMGGININARGQIALVYNISGGSRFASIQFTGRNATDPPGEMIYDEEEIKRGDGYGTFSNRWGDYNDIVIDPLDDSLFWCTAMYGSSTWKTRIASFKLLPIKAVDMNLTRLNNYSDGHSQCNSQLSPVITVRNSGTTTITSAEITMQLNGTTISSYTYNGNLAYKSSATLDLPPVTTIPGTHQLKILVNSVNSQQDEFPTNDTITLNFSILEAKTGVVSENFESNTFPPEEWRILNTDTGSATWEKAAVSSGSGTGAAIIRFYDYPALGQKDILMSPIISVTDSDSLILSFDVAYKQYGESSSYSDSLQVVISPDCGETFIPVWSRGGSDLASAAGYATSSFRPLQNEWKTIRLDIKSFVESFGAVAIGFRSVNSFGQNLYIDNINIKPVQVAKVDATITRVISPAAEFCLTSISPEVEIANAGKDTLTSARITYRLGTMQQSFDWTGSLAPGQLVVVRNMPAITVSTPGNSSFIVYTDNPNKVADNNTLNDTIRKEITLFAKSALPIKQGFEGNNFPPSNWSIRSSGAAYKWQQSSAASTEGVSSAWIRNYRFNSNTLKDEILSPVFRAGQTDSFHIRFDVAYALTGALGAKDTLEILLAEQCGTRATSLYRKGGQQLNTVSTFISYPSSDTIGFIPSLRGQWRSENIELSRLIEPDKEYQVIFRSTSNRGNNIFIDNINIYGVILPARLKQQGYLISPNPADNQITIQHLRQPVDLRAIQLLNSVGQLLYERRFQTIALNQVLIDLSSFASGVYQVKLVYRDKVISERIVKK